tara:strand:+ start:1437 stop:1631 length:195 start_codon:yes stop_codon:yes gene_type:complete
MAKEGRDPFPIKLLEEYLSAVLFLQHTARNENGSVSVLAATSFKAKILNSRSSSEVEKYMLLLY